MDKLLWLIPVLPLASAAILAVTKQGQRRLAASLSIGTMLVAFALACAAFAQTLKFPDGEGAGRLVQNFTWFSFGAGSVRLGFVLDPLSACMLVMITLVGTLIFIYSVGYMARDANFTRFFCFLSLFAAAMLGLVIANSLLLLFICWELVGLASYLLIGFWYHKPSAAAAAKKAFIVTRIGDMGLFLGMLWLYGSSGTLLFFDGGQGCLEAGSVGGLALQMTCGGLAVSTCISLLIFWGAMGKSGQVPLHVWLPDAMEGPTPVSALIHAATMVAAGVLLVARMYPLMEAGAAPGSSLALSVVTWVGVITAVFAALIATAQYDIKRILAYSTVSQLGFMMMGIGVGGYAVGMFHLITHAFFKALLFLGAGSVIHGCHEEQDIRRMGGVRKFMPLTFAAYAVGMMALAGVPLFFSGFWSKDEILDKALFWPPSRGPFYFGMIGVFLTAFYMTRQVWYVFYGEPRGNTVQWKPHESPRVMTMPLVVLAAGVVLLSLVGTPMWPWFEAYLNGHLHHLEWKGSIRPDLWFVILLATTLVFAGMSLSGWLYHRSGIKRAEDPDPLGKLQPVLFKILHHKFYVDEFYEATVVRLTRLAAQTAEWFERYVWGGLVLAAAQLVLALGWLNRLMDELLVNLGFDRGCQSLRGSGLLLSLLQNGQVQRYLRLIGVGLVGLALLFLWGLK